MSQGPFRRVENTTTQTAVHAKLQETSREMWWRPRRGSNLLSVKAYPGELPDERGVEFTTDILPFSGSSPNQIYWYHETCTGVQLRRQGSEDFACINLATFSNMQP